jgi:hypothetical protein
MIALLPDPRVTMTRANTALNHRLDQLEQNRNEFMHALLCIERAVKWLPEQQQDQVRQRLRRLGLTEQLDSMQDLVDLMEAA